MTESAQNSGSLRVIQSAAAIIVGIEALAVLAFAVFGLVTDLLPGNAKSLPAAVTMIVLYFAAGAWVSYIAYSLTKSKRWARSGAIFWQTCQLALASQSFTGRGASVVIGVALIVPSVAVLVLMFTKPVLAANKKEILGE
jgi:hypothetical protein